MVEATENDNHPQLAYGSIKAKRSRSGSLKKSQSDATILKNGLNQLNGSTPHPDPSTSLAASSNPSAASSPNPSGTSGTPWIPATDILSALLPGSSAAIAEKERQREAEAAYLMNFTRPRTVEDKERQQATRNRLSHLLAADHQAVAHPNIDLPFQDAVDVVRRLLPYHVFNIPEQELRCATDANWKYGSTTAKGKEKERPLPPHLQAIAMENEEASLALELHKQARSLKDRYLALRTREAKYTAPLDQMYWITHAELESEREVNSGLQAQLRAAQSEKDRQDREKRGLPPSYPTTTATTSAQNSTAQRLPYTFSYPATPGTAYGNFAAYAANPAYQAYYQQYAAALANAPRLPYAFSYPYGGYGAYVPPALPPGAQPMVGMPAQPQAPVPTASTTAATASASSSTAASTPVSTTPQLPAAPAPTPGPPNSKLPLSVPASALAALREAGIEAIPASSVTPAAPQPAVVLLSMSQDGSIANLTINLALLDPDKRAKLSAVLHGLVKTPGAAAPPAQST